MKQDFSQLGFGEQVKYIAFFYLKLNKKDIFYPKDLSETFELAHLPRPKNISQYIRLLVRNKVFIPKGDGYALHRDTDSKMEKEFNQHMPAVKFSHALRAISNKIADSDEKEFLDEAVSCYEAGACRAAIIMAWLVTMDHLYDHVLAKKLSEFNAILSQQKRKITMIKKREDFNELDESTFITICRSAGIITNDQRKILEEKLGIRNTAAHPNKIKISESKCISFVEDLVENIMQL